MPKAMIVTVGRQCAQVKFCLSEKKPEYLVLIGTATPACKEAINELLRHYKIPPSHLKVHNALSDDAGQTGKVVKLFNEGFEWLTKQIGIPIDEIEVDPTGGRKWMSAGVIMIASCLGLKMCYVQDPPDMKVVCLGNAYEQTGVLHEHRADVLFNEHDFHAAKRLYGSLASKLQDPRTIQIKSHIADGYLHWSQFKFAQSHAALEKALSFISQYQLLIKYSDSLKSQVEILQVLKANDERQPDGSKPALYDLLRREKFPEHALLSMYAQQQRCAEDRQYEQATIVLYRILEFIAQWRLSAHGIDTDAVPGSVRHQYQSQFRDLSRSVTRAAKEIPDKIALLDSWMLLFCLGDELLKGERPSFLTSLRGISEPRNMLWIEHGNRSIGEEGYGKFKEYVDRWMARLLPGFREEIRRFVFVKL